MNLVFFFFCYLVSEHLLQHTNNLSTSRVTNKVNRMIFIPFLILPWSTDSSAQRVNLKATQKRKRLNLSHRNDQTENAHKLYYVLHHNQLFHLSSNKTTLLPYLKKKILPLYQQITIKTIYHNNNKDWNFLVFTYREHSSKTPNQAPTLSRPSSQLQQNMTTHLISAITKPKSNKRQQRRTIKETRIVCFCVLLSQIRKCHGLKQ